MSREVTLDVRGMEPPEPLRLVLETIAEFVPGDELRLLIDCQPKPLYRILERNGYTFQEAPGTDATFVVTIRRRAPAPNS